MLNRLHITVVLAISLISTGSATNIVLTNDDGWAVAQIRAEYAALKTAGYNVSFSPIFRHLRYLELGLRAFHR